jgi:hypothetical protein
MPGLNLKIEMRILKSLLFLLFCTITSSMHADIALFVEEPYGTFGHMNPTGHAAIYFSNICADSPIRLRACLPGESGVVISRYGGINGYDWIAIPLIPYLYAVEKPDEVPNFADAASIARLRSDYRRAHLRMIVPDDPNGSDPKGNWDELVGKAFVRKIYVFQVATSADKDATLIAQLNSDANQSHFNLLSHNCADFSRHVINFYFPRASHRNFIADVGISTPKQVAKTLVRYSRRHPELEMAKFVIPQVPGTEPRSEAVHGVLESVVRSKKYALPLLLLHPWIGGTVAVAYVADGRFNPARGSTLLDNPNEQERLLMAKSRRELELSPSSGNQDAFMLLDDGWATAFLYQQ